MFGDIVAVACEHWFDDNPIQIHLGRLFVNTHLVIGLALAVGAPALKPLPQPAIVGEWVLESINSEGELLGVWETTDVFLPNGRLRTCKKGCPEEETGYEINATAVPAELDWYDIDGTTFRRAIWKVDGDTLVICNNTLSGEARPTSFTSPAGSNWFLLTYKRVIKKD
jgi:uncharacterized protein (TIGR03067 family)